MWSEMLKARIRRRKETEQTICTADQSNFTAATSKLPQSSLAQGQDMINRLKLDPDCLAEEEVLQLLRLLGLIQSQRLLPQQYLGARNWTKRSALSVQNPSSYQFGRSMAIMGDPEAKSCTWDQFTHVWADTKLAATNSRAMLEKAFPFFDEDGSGFITRQEMTDQFAELGGLLTAEEIQHFHDILDSDGNGVIDYAEFIQALQATMPESLWKDSTRHTCCQGSHAGEGNRQLGSTTQQPGTQQGGQTRDDTDVLVQSVSTGEQEISTLLQEPQPAQDERHIV